MSDGPDKDLAYAANFTVNQIPILAVLYDLRALLRDLAAGTVPPTDEARTR
jgi:hypothetical protein